MQCSTYAWPMFSFLTTTVHTERKVGENLVRKKGGSIYRIPFVSRGFVLGNTNRPLYVSHEKRLFSVSMRRECRKQIMSPSQLATCACSLLYWQYLLSIPVERGKSTISENVHGIARNSSCCRRTTVTFWTSYCRQKYRNRKSSLAALCLISPAWFLWSLFEWWTCAWRGELLEFHEYSQQHLEESRTDELLFFAMFFRFLLVAISPWCCPRKPVELVCIIYYWI